MSLAERILLLFSHPPVEHTQGEGEWTPMGATARLREAFPEILGAVRGVRVLDFGCGTGQQVVALAELGAREVVGLDVNARWLEVAGELAAKRGVNNVRFVGSITELGEPFDLIITQNSMEHFADPDEALLQMTRVLADGGTIHITFSPLWYTPYGAHMQHITSIPWVHLLFPERAVMAVRSRWFADGATRYEEVEGGLNRMSLRRWERLLRRQSLVVASAGFKAVWRMDRLRRLPVLRELLTHRVNVVLRSPPSAARPVGRQLAHPAEAPAAV
jgi:ubiquinone/menaquinone biosynthesis C-methylase UbiE